MKPNARRNGGKPYLAVLPTVQGLEKAALSYLGRYAASEFSLRGVLEHRLRRAAMRDPLFAENDTLQARLREAIETIIGKYRQNGVLDDASFAEMKTAGWRRAGRSARAIRQRLEQRGVARGAIEEALAQNAGDGDANDAELQAARALARRRKLGPFRASAASPEQKRKDLATLARAGFPLDVAKKVLGGTRD